MSLFKNLRLSKKMLISPTIVILFMVVSGGISFWGLKTQNNAMNDLYNNRFNGYRACTQVLDDLLLVQGNLYKLLGWANAKYDEKKIEALSKEQVALLKQTSDAINKSINSPTITAEEKKLYQDVQKDFGEYDKTAKDMLDMLQADLNAATMFMTTADEKFQLLDKTLNTLKAYENKLSDGNFKSSVIAYQQVKVIFVCVLLAAIAISLVISFALIRIILAPVNRTVAVIEEISTGDLTRRIDVDSNDEIGQMAQHFNSFADKLHDTVATIIQHANHVATSANQLMATAEQIATGAEEVANQAGTVATAGEEMAATSNEIAQNCQLAADGSLQATGAAQSGAAVVGETVTVMGRIAERVRTSAQTVETLGSRSDQIGAIIGTIEDIADQTNLLALNAAIEAARAGEQGRGFAVVADEVRALAERTTKATREIGEMIKAIQNETKGAVTAMEDGVREVQKGTEEAAKSGEALKQILDQINAVGMQVHQIATAAEQQTSTTSEISNNMQQITEVVQHTANGAQESAASASQLADLAHELQRLVAQFKVAA